MVIITQGYFPYESQMVLMVEGQTNLAYQVYANYKNLNSRLLCTTLLLCNTQSIHDVLDKCPWFVQLDIKARFYNIKFSEK